MKALLMLVVAIITFTTISVVSGQPATFTEVPKWAVGAEWYYEGQYQNTIPPGRQGRRSFVVKVSKIDKFENTDVYFLTDSREAYQRTGLSIVVNVSNLQPMALVDSNGGVSYRLAYPFPAWPLAPGKELSGKMAIAYGQPFWNTSFLPTILEGSAKITVQNAEDVQTPSGTFLAFKVTNSANISSAGGFRRPQTFTEEVYFSAKEGVVVRYSLTATWSSGGEWKEEYQLARIAKGQ